MTRTQKTAAALIAVGTLIGGASAAVAAAATPTATCTANPAITDGATTQSIRVTCSWPKPQKVTATATATVTATATATQTVTATPTPTPSPSPTVTQVASPSPSPTPTATAAPTPAGWQSAGIPAGTTLTVVPTQSRSGPGWSADTFGNVSVLTSGAVLDGLDIRGRVIDNGRTFTLRNSKVRCEGENDWCVAMPPGSKILSSEIPGTGTDGNTYSHAVAVWTGGSNAGNVIDRLLIHHHISGIRLDGGTTVTNSHIRDLPMGDPVLNLGTGQVNTSDHSGGIMGTKGSNVVLRGNRIEGGNTANVFLQPDVTDSTATISGWLVEGNEFVNVSKNGQVSSWGFRAESKPGQNPPLTIRGNTFTRGWEVAPFDGPTFTEHSGNRYTDGTSID